MTPNFESTTLNTFLQFVSVTDNATIYDNSSNHSQSADQNTSRREDCIEVIFSEMEFLPWDNPDNIISEQAENSLRRMKINMLGLLFLIGGTANIINMAVFYKQGLKDRVNLCLFTLSLIDGLYLTNSIVHNGEQLHIQFTSGARFGPISILMTNLNMLTLLSPWFYVSSVLSAIIATERCLCVYFPLKFKGLVSTRTMVVLIITICILIFGVFFVVSFRYRVGCLYDSTTGEVVVTGTEGKFYLEHKEVIDIIESSIYGVCLPGTVMVVVSSTTILTIVKLRQTMAWRSETSTSLSAREVALTKMLVGNSILFIMCTFPNAVNRFAWMFFPEINAGRRNQNFFLGGLWICQTLSYINATLNIVVYYVMGSHYRKTFHLLFSRKSQPEKM